LRNYCYIADLLNDIIIVTKNKLSLFDQKLFKINIDDTDYGAAEATVFCFLCYLNRVFFKAELEVNWYDDKELGIETAYFDSRVKHWDEDDEEYAQDVYRIEQTIKDIL
jgi:hypothetical protein